MISPKDILLHLEADLSTTELQVVELIIEKIDDELINICKYTGCLLGTKIINSILSEYQIKRNRYLKIQYYICEQYQKEGWRIKLEENYINFEIKQ